jgi:DMSO/TMAO reductase YedYZ molybdopterin-dependent catalytic subunit
MAEEERGAEAPKPEDSADDASEGVRDDAPPLDGPPDPAPPASAPPPTPPAQAAPAGAEPERIEPPRTAPSPPRRSRIAEPPEVAIEVPRRRLAAQTRRDFLLFAAGLLASAAGAWWLLPDATKRRLLPGALPDRIDTLAGRLGLSKDRRERVLDRALTFDDDVSEALYSRDRRVRTYTRADVTPLRNNYHGRTPGPEILPGWSLRLSGLASGAEPVLTIDQLLQRFALHEQVTRLVCVEGWSAVAWWGGIRFADLLAAYPPPPEARWAALRSSVSLDRSGRPEPYYVSIDLGTARHPQTLLATHQNGRPLTLAHGAPLRLLVPMKLGLKNIKAVTDIAYTAAEPADFWNERGYSRYDGL